MLYDGTSRLAGFLVDSYQSMSCYSQKAITFVLGQEIVDALNNGYTSTVAYLSALGSAALDPVLSLFGLR